MTPEQRRRRRRREKARRERSRLTAEAARRSLHPQGEQQREALATLAADVESAQEAAGGRSADAEEVPPSSQKTARGPDNRPESAIDAGRRWHVVVAKPRYARRAAKDLNRAGIPAVLTDERVEVVAENGRRRIVQRQLLRRVLFVGLKAGAPVDAVHGETYFVRDAVRDGLGRPIVVPPNELSQFVQALSDTLTERDPSAFEPGDEVWIKDGPFASFNGVVEDADFVTRRLKVGVQIFGRISSVGLDFSQVERT
ncbi:transcription termination/antitermination protein NusG [Methylobacterium nodulans]|uniref:NusG antitermination factor n=1 Tax=Methylobacterium nodulans (strain LMG 21967 / CNCM I-2342 / ORS 2060) TaxID=460265 RepID=B8IIT7_METNO|nr:transcription termination/antitermination protein NusG [Methylobacterium nodulans]ACL61732.1 NusG antitermination factor [Methylobacterium nodulans ORS 2060]